MDTCSGTARRVPVWRARVAPKIPRVEVAAFVMSLVRENPFATGIRGHRPPHLPTAIRRFSSRRDQSLLDPVLIRYSMRQLVPRRAGRIIPGAGGITMRHPTPEGSTPDFSSGCRPVAVSRTRNFQVSRATCIQQGKFKRVLLPGLNIKQNFGYFMCRGMDSYNPWIIKGR